MPSPEDHKTPMQDPRHLYPRPTFPEQQQKAPGSDQSMTPPADHGEESYRGSGKLSGRVALITGGDSGIGRAIALAYAREGADIVFTYLREKEDAQATEKLVRQAGQHVASYQMDQSDREACDGVITDTINAFGTLDILVNNAAYQRTYAQLSDMSDEEIECAFKTNIGACFYFCRAALEHMRPGGAIINTTSIQAYSPSIHLAPYAASKAAIANFTLALAEEAIEQGIRVNAVAPGPVWTPLIPATMPESKVEHFGENTLFQRPAQPAELAPVYVLLASNEASYITGEIFGVTGGRRQL